MKTVFVTGATGTIGSRLIPELLKEGNAVLKLLIRASSDGEMRRKLNSVLGFWNVDTHAVKAGGCIEGIRGDVTFEDLGMVQGLYIKLSREVTHIIHCAADIKLILPLKEARRCTLDGTKNVIRFSKKCIENGQFRRFNFISTMEVAGDMKGLIPEKFLDGKRSFLNTYEIAKAETEDFLQGLSEKGFPVTIYRPTMVVGDSGTGKTIKFQAFYHFLEDMFLSPPSIFVPFKADWRLDTVPVDFVAKVIKNAYGRKDYPGRVYHIVAGGGSAISLSDLRKELKVILEKLTGKKIKIPIGISPRIFYVLFQILHFFSFGRARKKLLFQLIIIRYLFLNQQFENRAMEMTFTREGIQVPRITDYLYTICEYYLNTKDSSGQY